MTQLGRKITQAGHAKWRDIITDYMNNPTFKEFSLWAISDDNLHQVEYVECLAFNQIVNLFDVVTEGLFTDSDAQPVVDALALMTIQQIYEVCSDSLAIGLGKSRSHWHHNDYHRERLLRIFNRGMRERIMKPDTSATDLLGGHRADYNKISLFEQSMTMQKQRRTVEAFAKGDSELAHNLEHATYQTLITHIEATAEMRRLMEGLSTYPLFIDGLHRRYQGVDNTLLHLKTTSKERLDIGTDTMLIVPTLAYATGIMYERAKPHAQTISTAMNEGILQALLDEASALIRIFNDVGTWFVEAPDYEAIELLDTLVEVETDDNSLLTAISKVAKDDSRFSRLEKDIFFHEVNILLDGIRYNDSPDTPMDEKVAYLKEIMHEMRQLYKTSCEQYTLTRLRAQSLPTTEFLIPIHRTVQFHKHLYGATFWNQTG
ncbi:MAG: hypothetical protein AAFR67_12630, partial [Chloroflexota bacterium]